MKIFVKIKSCYGNCLLVLVLTACVTKIANAKKGRRESESFYVGAVHPIRHSGSMSRHMLAQENEGELNVTSSTTIINEITANEEKAAEKTNAGTQNVIVSSLPPASAATESSSEVAICPMSLNCASQSAACIDCNFNYSCVYGSEVTVKCTTKTKVHCQGSRDFTKKMKCRYCYQTDVSEHSCIRNTTCRVVSAPRQRFITKCKVHNNVLCIGNRLFAKNLLCNWTKGYSWTTALSLSIVLGGLGADRFYLGLWQEGIGKLFSFGGLGVWTLVDVILIATGYLGPADGSLYIS